MQRTKKVVIVGNGMVLTDGSVIDSELLVISADIRPRDELARGCGLAVGERGGIVVDDRLWTSDASIYAVGEVALHRGLTFGLVAPGYRMAAVVASQIAADGSDGLVFEGADISTTLKLVGVDVSSFGDPFGTADSILNAAPSSRALRTGRAHRFQAWPRRRRRKR